MCAVAAPRRKYWGLTRLRKHGRGNGKGKGAGEVSPSRRGDSGGVSPPEKFLVEILHFGSF